VAETAEKTRKDKSRQVLDEHHFKDSGVFSAEDRAKNLISRESFRDVKLCYERALELLSLTIACSGRYTQIFELASLKEVIAGLYIQKVPSLGKNNLVFRLLISLSSESYSLLHP
jgi:hypothetical protein